MRKRERHLTDENDALKTELEQTKRYLDESHRQLRVHRDNAQEAEAARVEKLWTEGLLELNSITRNATTMEVRADASWVGYDLTLHLTESAWSKRLMQEVANRINRHG